MSKKPTKLTFLHTLAVQETPLQEEEPQISAGEEQFNRFEPFYLKTALCFWEIFNGGYTSEESQSSFSFSCGQSGQDNSKLVLYITGNDPDHVRDCLALFTEDLCDLAEDTCSTNFNIELKGNTLEMLYNSPKDVLKFIGSFLDRFNLLCPEDIDFAKSGIRVSPRDMKQAETFGPEQKLLYTPPMVYASAAIAAKCQVKALATRSAVPISYELLELLYKECAGLPIPQGMGLSLVH